MTQETAWARKLRRNRLILAIGGLALAAWLALTAMAPTTGGVQRTIMLLVAAMVLLHILVFHLGGMRLLDRARHWPRPLAAGMALLFLAVSPLGLYPLGLLAIVLALTSGAAAAAPLATAGLLILSPFLIMGVILLAILIGKRTG